MEDGSGGYGGVAVQKGRLGEVGRGDQVVAVAGVEEVPAVGGSPVC